VYLADHHVFQSLKSLGIIYFSDSRSEPLRATSKTIRHEMRMMALPINFPCENVSPCSICKLITLDALLSDEGFKHHRSTASLRSETDNGCKLCGLTIDSIIKLTARLWVSQGKAQSNDAKLLKNLRQDPFFGSPIDFSITLEYLRRGHHQHPGLLSSDLLFVIPRTLDEDLMFHHIRPIVGFYTDDGTFNPPFSFSCMKAYS
jgi:hypothetical protein